MLHPACADRLGKYIFEICIIDLAFHPAYVEGLSKYIFKIKICIKNHLCQFGYTTHFDIKLPYLNVLFFKQSVVNDEKWIFCNNIEHRQICEASKWITNNCTKVCSLSCFVFCFFLIHVLIFLIMDCIIISNHWIKNCHKISDGRWFLMCQLVIKFTVAGIQIL